ncbi:MAG: 4,5-DOPA dioxygenase extradiol [Clostridiaceae bacterium]
MRMPVMFVGHGSPMNAITDNEYKDNWIKIGQVLKPKAIVCVSAHWYTNKTNVNPTQSPEQIYDMYGFPPELYAVKYPVMGSPILADRVKDLIGPDCNYNTDWGIDHGTWSVLKWMFPDADIPVIQVSIDGTQSGDFHYRIGEMLAPLRDEDILIIGSGNIVHNLRKVGWDMTDGYSWAVEFDTLIKDAIIEKRFEKVIDYKSNGESARLAVPTPDHYYPLLYVLGASTSADQTFIFNDSCDLGSISMTSYLLGEDVINLFK